MTAMRNLFLVLALSALGACDSAPDDVASPAAESEGAPAAASGSAESLTPSQLELQSLTAQELLQLTDSEPHRVMDLLWEALALSEETQVDTWCQHENTTVEQCHAYTRGRAGWLLDFSAAGDPTQILAQLLPGQPQADAWQLAQRLLPLMVVQFRGGKAQPIGEVIRSEVMPSPSREVLAQRAAQRAQLAVTERAVQVWVANRPSAGVPAPAQQLQLLRDDPEAFAELVFNVVPAATLSTLLKSLNAATVPMARQALAVRVTDHPLAGREPQEVLAEGPATPEAFLQWLALKLAGAEE